MDAPVYNFSRLPNSLGPEDPLTIRTLFQQALSKVLGTALPKPVGNIVSGWIGNFALKQMGVKYDYAMDVPLTTGGMSPRGVANSYLRTQISQLAPMGFERAQRNAELRFWENFARIQKSEAQWAKEHGDFNPDEYSKYITAEAIGYQHGPASMLYSFADPYDMAKAAPYMSMATGNLFNRHYMMRGDRRRASSAVQFMERLFTDESGERFTFDRKDYGGMGITEVSALTAALTKELDPLTGADGGSQELKQAVNQFRGKVKEYANALAPLKDIFGQDIPSMLRTVEELSGRSIATMDPQQARDMAMQVSTGILYGNYTIGDVRGVNQRLTQKMADMGMSDLSVQQTALLSTDILNAGTTNVPRFMRKDRLIQAAYDRVAASAGSSGAEYMDRAYALWAHNQRAANKEADISVEKFRSLFAKTAPADMMSKALEVSGATSLVDLDRGMLYNEYQTAKDRRIGASMAAEIASRDLYETGIQSLINRHKDMNPNVALALSDLMTMTRDSDVDILDKSSVRRKLGADKYDSGAYEQAINLIHASSYDKNSGNAQYVAREYTIARNIRLAEKQRVLGEQRFRLLKELDMAGGAADVKSIFVNIIEGNLDFASIKKRLANVGITDEGTAKDLVDINKAVDTLYGVESKESWITNWRNDPNNRGKSDQDADAEYKKYVSEKYGILDETKWKTTDAGKIAVAKAGKDEAALKAAYDKYVNDTLFGMKRDLSLFALTAEGIGNREFNAALTQYHTALEQNNVNDAVTASQDMLIARLIGDDTLHTYFGANPDDDAQQREVLRTIVANNKAKNAGEIREALKARIEDYKLREVFGDKLHKEADAAFEQNGENIGGNGDNLITISEYKSFLERSLEQAKTNKDAAAQKELRSQINTLNSISNQFYQGPAGSTDTMRIFELIKPVVDKLAEVLEELAEKLARDGSGASNGTPTDTPPKKSDGA